MGLLKELNELNKPKELISTLLFYLSILFFIIGFQFSDTMINGWYQQFMPNLNGAAIQDITFLDSLTGFAVTNVSSSNSYILKTTNKGDNWTIKYNSSVPFQRVEFVNGTTGFVNANYDTLYKTTNAGENWQRITLPMDLYSNDMYVLTENTIWLAHSESLTGGAFLTTNGGVNWFRRYNNPNSQPEKIYMFNSRIGFISCTNTNLAFFKTTDGGNNWAFIPGVDGFKDIYFADSLTGWKANGLMKKTTDGGLNWVTQQLPSGSNFVYTDALKFSNINQDTIWAVGANVIIGPIVRAVLYRTVNSGNNWLYQVPDTSINIYRYFNTQFTDRLKGWAYSTSTGVYTTTGGGDTFYTAIKLANLNIPDEYKLFQNYPNPFNPITYINYKLQITNYVILSVFDITGKRIVDLINQKQNAGSYRVAFDGTNYSSGIYFYSLFADGKLIDTKKMILLK